MLIILFVAFQEKRLLLVQEVCTILRQDFDLKTRIHAIFVKFSSLFACTFGWHACTFGWHAC